MIFYDSVYANFMVWPNTEYSPEENKLIKADICLETSCYYSAHIFSSQDMFKIIINVYMF